MNEVEAALFADINRANLTAFFDYFIEGFNNEHARSLCLIFTDVILSHHEDEPIDDALHLIITLAFKKIILCPGHLMFLMYHFYVGNLQHNYVFGQIPRPANPIPYVHLLTYGIMISNVHTEFNSSIITGFIHKHTLVKLCRILPSSFVLIIEDRCYLHNRIFHILPNQSEIEVLRTTRGRTRILIEKDDEPQSYTEINSECNDTLKANAGNLYVEVVLNMPTHNQPVQLLWQICHNFEQPRELNSKIPSIKKMILEERFSNDLINARHTNMVESCITRAGLNIQHHFDESDDSE